MMVSGMVMSGHSLILKGKVLKGFITSVGEWVRVVPSGAALLSGIVPQIAWAHTYPTIGVDSVKESLKRGRGAAKTSKRKSIK